jgi:hypothetical protein
MRLILTVAVILIGATVQAEQSHAEADGTVRGASDCDRASTTA